MEPEANTMGGLVPESFPPEGTSGSQTAWDPEGPLMSGHVAQVPLVACPLPTPRFFSASRTSVWSWEVSLSPAQG